MAIRVLDILNFESEEPQADPGVRERTDFRDPSIEMTSFSIYSFGRSCKA